MKFKFVVLISLVALAALVAGCGSKGAGYPSAADTQQPTQTADSGSTDTTSSDSSDTGKKGKIPKVSGSASEKPTIAVTSGDPPTELTIKDIKKGSGAAAKSGDKVSVNYVGKNWSDSKEFDTSWGKEPFEFTLGQGAVIKGWDEGVVGMKKGGRRLLVIPPDLGYGAQGQGSIPANETLVFVVDLDKVS
jgi:peptidylprolyl isomerase